MDPALVRTAPSVVFVKTESKGLNVDFFNKKQNTERQVYETPESLKKDPAGISTKNYNSVPVAQTQRWGTGVSSNGRRVPEGITIPEVGERPAAGELVSVPLSPEEGKKRGWGATKEYAMFGNENYEKLANNLKPVVSEATDIGKKAR